MPYQYFKDFRQHFFSHFFLNKRYVRQKQQSSKLYWDFIGQEICMEENLVLQNKLFFIRPNAKHSSSENV